ncbi:RNA polymerase-binding transcription factor DksA [Scopulibacillus daqui]|uniref:RNA polymerase-binding transcription factor DksA n=1 Tax=Scopulibacillus daqui TaxID=1469162 RepID=A0ABS2Q185_9BACL|nr:TraR/DksA C4-type zinc finger protein [Scopulibacillus daqui]MBM7646052.1 RNA polymerase-binding transcription factor DksA [Scopulibacillus daqui]
MARQKQLITLLSKRPDLENESEMSSVDNHLVDSAGDMVDREKVISEKMLIENELQEINEAWERIEEGGYGICVDTGEDIPYECLKALSYAKRTKEAQEKLDSHRDTGESDKSTTSRLQKPKGKIEDSKNRTMKRIEEEHHHIEKSGYPFK